MLTGQIDIHFPTFLFVWYHKIRMFIGARFLNMPVFKHPLFAHTHSDPFIQKLLHCVWILIRYINTFWFITIFPLQEWYHTTEPFLQCRARHACSNFHHLSYIRLTAGLVQVGAWRREPRGQEQATRHLPSEEGLRHGCCVHQPHRGRIAALCCGQAVQGHSHDAG